MRKYTKKAPFKIANATFLITRNSAAGYNGLYDDALPPVGCVLSVNYVTQW